MERESISSSCTQGFIILSRERDSQIHNCKIVTVPEELTLGLRSEGWHGIIKKNRDITLLTKVWIIKAMVFLVSMYRCESWTIKKAEHWRIDTFELWCWRRLLRVPWTARRSNQSILEEINPEYSVQELNAEDEVPVLWPPEAKSQFIGKAPDTGKDWGQEKGATEDEMIGWHHRLNGRDFEKILGNSEGQGSLVCCSPWGCKESDMI